MSNLIITFLSILRGCSSAPQLGLLKRGSVERCINRRRGDQLSGASPKRGSVERCGAEEGMGGQTVPPDSGGGLDPRTGEGR
jgi:hypothetical protein